MVGLEEEVEEERLTAVEEGTAECGPVLLLLPEEAGDARIEGGEPSGEFLFGEECLGIAVHIVYYAEIG